MTRHRMSREKDVIEVVWKDFVQQATAREELLNEDKEDAP